jgi:hypothetical protein
MHGCVGEIAAQECGNGEQAPLVTAIFRIAQIMLIVRAHHVRELSALPPNFAQNFRKALTDGGDWRFRIATNLAGADLVSVRREASGSGSVTGV